MATSTSTQRPTPSMARRLGACGRVACRWSVRQGDGCNRCDRWYRCDGRHWHYRRDRRDRNHWRWYHGCDWCDRRNRRDWRARCHGTVGATGATGAVGFTGATGGTGATGAVGARRNRNARPDRSHRRHGVYGTAGATGATGSRTHRSDRRDGSNRATGTAGATVLSGTVPPAPGVGVDGDFYIDTATSTIYGPKAGGVWPSGVPLVGATGATGATGEQELLALARQAQPDPPALAAPVRLAQQVSLARKVSQEPLEPPARPVPWALRAQQVGRVDWSGRRNRRTGTQGPIGPTGVTGSTGTAGATGATGVQGPIGPIGATGATGATARPAPRCSPALFRQPRALESTATSTSIRQPTQSMVRRRVACGRAACRWSVRPARRV